MGEAEVDLSGRPDPDNGRQDAGNTHVGGGSDLGGDEACWMRRVCPECGRLADVDPPTTCAQCGTYFEAD